MQRQRTWLKWLGAGAVALASMGGCGNSATQEEPGAAKTGGTPGSQGYNQASDPSKKK